MKVHLACCIRLRRKRPARSSDNGEPTSEREEQTNQEHDVSSDNLMVSREQSKSSTPEHGTATSHDGSLLHQSVSSDQTGELSSSSSLAPSVQHKGSPGFPRLEINLPTLELSFPDTPPVTPPPLRPHETSGLVPSHNQLLSLGQSKSAEDGLIVESKKAERHASLPAPTIPSLCIKRADSLSTHSEKSVKGSTGLCEASTSPDEVSPETDKQSNTPPAPDLLQIPTPEYRSPSHDVPPLAVKLKELMSEVDHTAEEVKRNGITALSVPAAWSSASESLSSSGKQSIRRTPSEEKLWAQCAQRLDVVAEEAAEREWARIRERDRDRDRNLVRKITVTHQGKPRIVHIKGRPALPPEEKTKGPNTPSQPHQAKATEPSKPPCPAPQRTRKNSVGLPWEAAWHGPPKPKQPPAPAPRSDTDSPSSVPSCTYTLANATRLPSMKNPTMTVDASSPSTLRRASNPPLQATSRPSLIPRRSSINTLVSALSTRARVGHKECVLRRSGGGRFDNVDQGVGPSRPRGSPTSDPASNGLHRPREGNTGR